MLDASYRRVRRLAKQALARLPFPRAPARPATVRGDRDYLVDRLTWFARKKMLESGTPGLGLCLVNPEGVIWSAGFGNADRERRLPAQTDTIYQIGSITKVFTALAIMQRVERGDLDLDAPIFQYLPDFSIRTRWPNARPITVRSLLCHHSGLPTYLLKGFFSSTPLSQFPELLRDEHLAFQPHTVFNYSNLGSNILGLILERQLGQPYTDIVREQILVPLGMIHTVFAPDPTTAPRVARGHVHDLPADPTPIRDTPAGGLYSNVTDLAQFMQMVLNFGSIGSARVVGRAQVEQMLTPQYPDCVLDFGHRFGLGWMLSGLPLGIDQRQAWHNGGTKAYVSQMALLPDQGLGVVVLANSDSAGPAVYEIAEEALRLGLEVESGISTPGRDRPPAVNVSRPVLEKYVGDYSLMGSLATISLGRQRLMLNVLNHCLDLVPESETRFRVEYNFLGLKLVPIAFPNIEFIETDGRMFAVLRDRVVVPAERIPPYPIPDQWRRHVGDQRLLNPDEEYLVELEHCRMEIRNGRLLMDIRIDGIEKREIHVVVVPFSDTEAYVFGLGRNVGDVAQTYEDQGRLCTRFSGYRFLVER